MLGTKATLDTMVLSQGQSWVAAFFPRGGRIFTAGTTCETTIADPAGNIIATWEPVSITPNRIDFVTAATDSDLIPNGSYFRVTVHYPASDTRPAIDENLSRGSVLRDDNPSPLAAARSTNIALTFTDDMSGPGVDPAWVRIGGNGHFIINNNSSYHLPNAMSGNFALFETAAGRYRAQTNQNAVKVEVETIVGGFGGAGKTTVIICSNQQMTSWVGMQFETGINNNNIHILEGKSPTSWSIQNTAHNVVHDLDRYSFIYDDLADNYLVYKGTDFSTPLIDWQDEGHTIPHGNGYRYPALLFQSSLLSTGLQLSGWSIKDN